MEDNSGSPLWLGPVLAGIIFLVIFGLYWPIGKAIRRLRGKQTREVPEDDGLTVPLVHTRLLLVFGIFGTGMFWGLGIPAFFIDERFMEFSGMGLVAFGFSNLFLIAEYFRSRHVLHEEGLQYSKFFGGGGTISWQDITKVRFGTFTNLYKLTDHTGNTVRISAMSKNIVFFAQRLLNHVDHDRIDRRAMRILKQSAEGKPPTLIQ